MSDSVPFGPITAGTTYSVSQWNIAWASKVDVTNGSLVSPTITGTPTAPTATPGTSTTQIATTAFVNAAGGAYVPLSGGTMTGGLTLPGNPDSALQAAPKQYVDARAPGGSAGRNLNNFIGDGINVTDADISPAVVMDGQEGYFRVVFFNNATTVSISGPTFTASIQAGSNVLTLSNGSPAYYPQPSDVGSKIAVAGAGQSGSILEAVIESLDYEDDPDSITVVLSNPALETLSSVANAEVLWPYFDQTDVGKSIWMGQGGAPSWLWQPFSATTWGNNGPYGGVIASVQAYNAITLSAVPATNCNGFVIRVVWGTDNTSAIIAARNLQATRGLRRLHYEAGGTTQRRVCAFNMLGSQASLDALANSFHYGNNVSTFFTDAAGNQLRYHAIPFESWHRAPPPLQRRLDAAVHLPCSNAASTVLYVPWGDSMATDAPTQSASWSQTTRVFQRFRAANMTRKTLQEGTNFGIGGATWQWLNGGQISATLGWPLLPAWYAQNYSDTWDQIVNALAPTCIFLLENGGNDRQYIHQASAQAVLNRIRQDFTKTGGLAPDAIMCNMRPWPIASQNGRPLFTDQDGEERSAMLHRSMARMQGIGFLDYSDAAHLAFFGWSPLRMQQRLVPSFSVGTTLNSTAPLGLGQACRDFEVNLVLGTSAQAGAAVWAVQPLWIQIGNHPQNGLRFSLDSTSTYLTMRAHTWGFAAGEFNAPQASVSIANGSTGLTVAAPTAVAITSVTSATIDPVTGGTLISTTGYNWPSGCVGNALIIPSAQFTWSGAPSDTGNFRTQIIGRPSVNEILVADALPVAGTNIAAGTWHYGPMLFVPTDAQASADVVLEDGVTTLTTTVASYVSMTSVTLSAAWTGTSRSAYSATVFVGRVSLPTITCNGVGGTRAIAAGSALASNPNLRIAVRGDDLEVDYRPYASSYTPTATLSIAASSNVLTSSTAIFEPGHVGQAIQVPGAGASGGTLLSYISAVNSSTSITLTNNASTALSSVVVKLIIANSGPGGGGQIAPSIVYRGPVERYGGQFIPIFLPSGPLSVAIGVNGQYIGVPHFYAPELLEYEAWGTDDGNYEAGGFGGTHNDSTQAAIVDQWVLDAQNFAARD